MTDYTGGSTGAELDKAGNLVSTGTDANLLTSGSITTTGTVIAVDADISGNIGIGGTVTIGGIVVDLLGLTDAPARVTPQTVSGVLTPGSSINQIRDSGAFTMPLASNVAANVVLIVELPEKFANNTPTITASGANTFSTGTDTDTVINFNGAGMLTFTSNGSTEWSL